MLGWLSSDHSTVLLLPSGGVGEAACVCPTLGDMLTCTVIVWDYPAVGGCVDSVCGGGGGRGGRAERAWEVEEEWEGGSEEEERERERGRRGRGWEKGNYPDLYDSDMCMVMYTA